MALSELHYVYCPPSTFPPTLRRSINTSLADPALLTTVSRNKLTNVITNLLSQHHYLWKPSWQAFLLKMELLRTSVLSWLEQSESRMLVSILVAVQFCGVMQNTKSWEKIKKIKIMRFYRKHWNGNNLFGSNGLEERCSTANLHSNYNANQNPSTPYTSPDRNNIFLA